jgi:hypothetical protein
VRREKNVVKTYPTEVLLSITTGILLCGFDEMHECCEFLVGYPTWTHQFAHRPFVEQLKAAVLRQHPQLSNADAKGVGKDNWLDFKDRMIAEFGTELPLARAS